MFFFDAAGLLTFPSGQPSRPEAVVEIAKALISEPELQLRVQSRIFTGVPFSFLKQTHFRKTESVANVYVFEV